MVLGVGSALPERRVTNDELAETVDTTDAWIVERTGIRSRYVAGEGETTASLAAEASRRALDHAGAKATDIDLIVLATATPDQTFPSCFICNVTGPLSWTICTETVFASL